VPAGTTNSTGFEGSQAAWAAIAVVASASTNVFNHLDVIVSLLVVAKKTIAGTPRCDVYGDNAQ
jgi:hypothetical protein